ncbi:MAG: polysaccharide deacetylase family protein [Bradymonadaceae bacterium]|nr:polysaccharide deacetylase family protein [Lujinxingiaceae bacterium]
MVTSKGPSFVLSLDFELYWGMRDLVSLDEYRAHLLGAREAIPAMLELFERYGIHATWATVGLLFFESRAELLACLPSTRPRYARRQLCPFEGILSVGKNEREDPFHFAPSLIAQIAATPGQEVATHTFSHYYCLERGQNKAAFRADLLAAISVARRRGIKLSSIVFPRNQCNPAYLPICRELGILAYRGNADSWIYRSRAAEQESSLRRVARFADSYLPLSRASSMGGEYDGQTAGQKAAELPVDVTAGRFLRPFDVRLRSAERLRLLRIQREFEQVVAAGGNYHLWWHPHNFGANLQENLSFLGEIFEHYLYLKQRYGVRTQSMLEVALDSTISPREVHEEHACTA